MRWLHWRISNFSPIVLCPAWLRDSSDGLPHVSPRYCRRHSSLRCSVLPRCAHWPTATSRHSRLGAWVFALAARHAHFLYCPTHHWLHSRRMTNAPNHALQRTAPRVTVAAFHVRSRLVRARRCLTSVASFFAPPSQLPRHAPLSLSLGSLGVSARTLNLSFQAAAMAARGFHAEPSQHQKPTSKDTYENNHENQ